MRIFLPILTGILSASLTFSLLDHSTAPLRNSSVNYEVAVACGYSYLLGCQQPVNEIYYCTEQAKLHSEQLFKTLEDAK